MKIDKAIILSAGYGKRLNPLTLSRPKSLLKINKKTLLENIIYLLEKFGIKEIKINTHYLSDQIASFINSKKFNSKIILIEEHKQILDTGGGMLNALKYFNESFICINPDTVWNLSYVKELKKMENNFFLNKKKCYLLVVDKEKSFDKNLKGDFNLQNGLIKRERNKDLKYIYTGLQIINPKAFLNINDKVFSINKVWDNLIQRSQLYALESHIHFLHVSTLDVYKKLNIK